MVNKKVPELDQLDGICDVPREKITAVLVHEDFMEAMEDTGIPVRNQKGLNILQHHALVMMTDPTDKRPFHIRLKESGISSATWKAWLRNPVFASFLEQFYENALGDHMNAAHLSLMNQVDKGNVPALTLYYSMTGRYDPRSQQERDVAVVINGLLEILQRKLDPNTLSEISDELQVLMGRKKAITPVAEPIIDAEEVPEREVELTIGEAAELARVNSARLQEQRKEKYESEGWVQDGFITAGSSMPVNDIIPNKEAFLESGAAQPKNKLTFDTDLFNS